jgi:hypothetical protein
MEPLSMPSSSISFPKDLGKRLEHLRERVLELSQNELAQSADVAQGTYSNLMIGKGVRARSAKAIVAAIQHAVGQHIQRTKRTSEEAAELLRDVAWAVAVLEGAGNAEDPEGATEPGPPTDMKVLDRLAQQTMARPIKIHQPGGAVPSDAIPYVARDHDKLVLATLQLPSFAMLVRGPSQCGKSTTLSLLERRAHEIGIETAWFDPQPPPSDSSLSLKYDADADAGAALAVSELLQARWGLQRPRRGPINSIAKVTNWLLEELAPTASRPRLLILDDLVTLGGAAAERWLSLFVRAMVNQRATRGVNISIAVGLTDHFGTYFARKLMLISSVVHWQPMLALGWLNHQDLVALWRDLRERQATDLEDESALSAVFETFKGQPYLTHAALIDTKFRNLVREWQSGRLATTAEAIRQVRWYRQHLNAIKLVLCGPTYEPNDEVRNIINSFAENCKATSPSAWSQIDSHHGLFFSTAKLTDQLGNPALELYRLLAEDLQKGSV